MGRFKETCGYITDAGYSQQGINSSNNQEKVRLFAHCHEGNQN
jgi:hypothetical protein